VNSHHHVGLTPFQLGSPDYPLELWFASRLGARAVDPYLDTLYAAFEMLESGITTVQHLHGWRLGPAARVVAVADQILKAYQDLGMRVSYSFTLRDQNRLVYEDDAAFAKRLPAPLATELRPGCKPRPCVPGSSRYFYGLGERWHRHERSRIQLAPANLHWCSTRRCRRRTSAMQYGVGMHMHLLETAYQKVLRAASYRHHCSTLSLRHGLLAPSDA
jgi:cytosine/adenosine deaminase-related metal-dependent hydrolase